MLKIAVEGVYESDIGSGQKKYQNFSYEFLTSRITPRGIETHVMRRFIPMLIAKDKNKKNVIFSRLQSFVITNIQKVDDNKDSILGKDIMEFDYWQIQDLAATLDLYEIPLAGTCSITELREKAVLAYMKKVLKIPMKDGKDKSQLEFFKKLPDGTFKLELGNEKVIVEIPESYFAESKHKENPKKGLSYFTQKAGQAVANKILEITGNQTINPQQINGSNNEFPSAEELENGTKDNFIKVQV